MWTRAELKTRGKAAFKQNYWFCVLVSLILILVAGNFTSRVTSQSNADTFTIGSDTFSISLRLPSIFQVFNYLTNDTPISDTADTLTGISNSFTVGPFIIATSVATLALIILIAGTVVKIFVLNPLYVGCTRFYVNNLNKAAGLDEITFAFREGSFVNIGLAQLTTNIFTFLWYLLLIIPGIIKNYEWYLVPYLLADHPEWTGTEVREESRRLMDGNKMETFVLDLSFIGWNILSGLTAGILGVFFVNPYVDSTHAALYERLVEEDAAARHMTP